MSGLLVLGAGGHGKVVADAALAGGEWAEVAFLDDRANALAGVLGLPVLGDMASLASLGGRFSHAVVAVGDPRKRLALISSCAAAGYKIALVVHPRATISPFASLAAGTVAMAGAIVNPGARAGEGVIINTGATVDHDCRLADGVHVCPGVHIAGDVVVGERTWLGIGSSIKQGVTIGCDVMVGAGSVVISDVADGLTVVGVPARQLVRSHLPSGHNQ